MFTIQNLTKKYPGGTIGVQDLSLTIREGEMIGFIGQNGAGKTTTLRSAAGILDFDQGEITINNISIRKNSVEYKKQIAFVPDNPELYDFLTGMQFLNFISDIYKVSQSDRKNRILKMAEQFNIASNLDDLISSYSHGMKQKLALIAAFVHQPQLIMLDEPFVGLDPFAFHALKEILQTSCNNGAMVFFSSHVLDVVEKLCDNIAVIKQGKLICTGSMKSLIGNSGLESVFMELVNHDGN